MTMKDALMRPKHPERICWGCERYCPANDLSCREDRVAHPIELFGGSWESVISISQEVTDRPGEQIERRDFVSVREIGAEWGAESQ
jgi:hypothetical protein